MDLLSAGWVLSHFDKYVVQPKARIWLVERNPGEDTKSIHRVSSDFEATMYDQPFTLSMRSHGLGNGESKCILCSSLHILLEIAQPKLNINHLKSTLKYQFSLHHSAKVCHWKPSEAVTLSAQGIYGELMNS